MRRGHSLAELLVTLAFLGVALGAISAAIIHGGRSTMAAAASQEAVGVAAALLDSLVAAPLATVGGTTAGPYRARWTIHAHAPGEYVVVTVEPPVPGPATVTVRGLRVPRPVPVLP